MRGTREGGGGGGGLHGWLGKGMTESKGVKETKRQVGTHTHTYTPQDSSAFIPFCLELFLLFLQDRSNKTRVSVSILRLTFS